MRSNSVALCTALIPLLPISSLLLVWNAGSGSSGPADSFTGHGTWPDRCDGTYDSYCDPSTAVSYEPGTVVKLLQDNGRTELLNYMNQMWLGNNGNEDLWAHEQAKHGTCISTLKPSCFSALFSPSRDL